MARSEDFLGMRRMEVVGLEREKELAFAGQIWGGIWEEEEWEGWREMCFKPWRELGRGRGQE